MIVVIDVAVIEILAGLLCDRLLFGYIREYEMKSMPAPVGADR